MASPHNETAMKKFEVRIKDVTGKFVTLSKHSSLQAAHDAKQDYRKTEFYSHEYRITCE